MKQVYLKATNDTTRIKVLIAIGEKYELNNLDSAYNYFQKALNLSENYLLKNNESTKSIKTGKNFLSQCISRIGAIYSSRGLSETALGYYKRTLVFREELEDKKGIAATLNNIGISYGDLGNYKLALEYHNKSLNIKETLNDKRGMAASYNNLGTIYRSQGLLGRALNSYQKSLELLQGSTDKVKIGNSLNNIGICYKDMGYIDSALFYYKSAMKYREETGDKIGVASIYNNIGIVLIFQGDIPNALDNYSKGLKIQETIGDKRGMRNSYNNMALIYDRQGDFKQALQYYLTALKLDQETGSKEGESASYLNIGSIYLQKGELEIAYNNFQKSLKIAEEVGSKREIANARERIGSYFELKKDIDEAMNYYQKSYEIHKISSNKRGLTNAMTSIGNLYIKKENYVKAIEFLGGALNNAQELGYPTEIKNAAELLSFALEKTGKHKEALENFQLYVKMRDSLNNIENQKATIMQKAKFDFEKKQALSQAEFEKKEAFANLELERQRTLIELNRQEVLYLEKDNELKELTLIKNQTELREREVFSDNQNKKLELMSKEKELDKLNSEKREADLKRQKTFNYMLIGGVFLVSIVLLIAIRGYIQKKKDNSIIKKQKMEVEEQKAILLEKNDIIEEKQKEILDSINYAKRIQLTLLAHDDFLCKYLPEHFVFFQPKDIVSGDFYWATSVSTVNTSDSPISKKFYLAICDSTGHGVPGAFMSLLNIGFLSEAINEKGIHKPGEIFDFARKKLVETISRDGQQDGFDGILLCIDQSNNSISYAAANNAPILIKQNPGASTGTTTKPELMELYADRMPVGIGEKKDNFKTITIDAKKGDLLYLYTDGFADQFGGPKGKKFKYKQLNELIFNIHNNTIRAQRDKLKNTFENWKGTLEQVDDVCIIGIRI
ncbi:MAG: tetratricopeptide repeat protein [Bacteroidota bacterium]